MSNDISALKEQISDLKGRIRKLQEQLNRSLSRQGKNDEMLRFEMLISEISTKLINLSIADAKSIIESGLELVCHFLDVDQSAVVELDNISANRRRR